MLNKKNEILSEIESSIKNIDGKKSDLEKLENDIATLKKQIEELKKDKSNLVNEEYASQKIDKEIKFFIKEIKLIFKEKYKSDLICDDLYKTIKLKINNNSIDQILIEQKSFKHNSSRLNLKKVLQSFLFLITAASFLLIAYLNKEYYGGVYKPGMVIKFYTNFGVILNILGVILIILGLGNMIFINMMLSVELKNLINKKKSEELNNTIDFLNSIHQLPKEIKEMVKKNIK
jgi:uncharacterized membrane protein